MCWRSPIIKALNGLPVYYRYHIKNGPALGKGLKIVHYQNFTKKRNQSQKRKEKKRKENEQRTEKRKEKEKRWKNEKDEKACWVWEGDKETGDWVWKDEEDEEDELANQFNATMNISTKRRRIGDV